MSTDYWQSLAFNGASAQGVVGVDTRPYSRLSEGSSFMAAKVLQDAAAIFPEFDGINQLALPLPPDYASPTKDGFLLWHTAHQVQFLKEQSPGWAAGDVRAVTFGASPNPIENDTFLLSADGKRVIRILTLQTTEIARMPLEDQLLLAELPAFRAIHSNQLGLWPADDIFGVAASGGRPPPATVAEARERIEETMIRPLEALITGSARYVAALRNETTTAENMTVLYPNLFLDQIEYIRNRLAKMAVFNPDVIRQMVFDLKVRFERVEKYSDVVPPDGPSPITKLTNAANSTDNLAGVKRALSIFLQTEVKMRDFAATNWDIIETGKLQNRSVDSPLLVSFFQLQENYSDEADARARSEELNQLRSLMDAYTRMQQLVNETLRKFDPVKFQKDNEKNPDAVERKSFLGVSLVTDASQLTASDWLIVSMFDRTSAQANGNKFLPIERDTNAGRPTFAINTPNTPFLPAYTQKEWELFSQDLSKVSKILSADSQARMDQINRISKEKNRAYELATETVNKMTDILRSIIN